MSILDDNLEQIVEDNLPITIEFLEGHGFEKIMSFSRVQWTLSAEEGFWVWKKTKSLVLEQEVMRINFDTLEVFLSPHFTYKLGIKTSRGELKYKEYYRRLTRISDLKSVCCELLNMKLE